MDWFDSFLFYKYYATIQAVGWIVFAFSILASDNPPLLTKILFLMTIIFGGFGFSYLVVGMFQ